MKENICGEKAGPVLQEWLLKYLKSIIFPKELRGMRLKTMLGTGLEC
jgi:hypothetical protein